MFWYTKWNPVLNKIYEMMLLKHLLLSANKQVNCWIHVENPIWRLLHAVLNEDFYCMSFTSTLALEDLLHAHFVMRSVVYSFQQCETKIITLYLAPHFKQASLNDRHFKQASIWLCCMRERNRSTYLHVSKGNSNPTYLSALSRKDLLDPKGEFPQLRNWWSANHQLRNWWTKSEIGY